MKKLSVDEIKNIELSILIDVAEFCEQNNIDYFISCGTLLGAVRHNGFIPWDDDVDVTMPRDSYEKFIATYRSKNGFKAASINKYARYNRTFTRVMSMKTCRLTHRTFDFDFRVCIDVFPMDFFDAEQQAWDVYQHLFANRNDAREGAALRTSLIGRIKEIVKASFIAPVARPVFLCIRALVRPALSEIRILRELLLSNRSAKKRDRYVRDNSGQKGRFLSSTLAPTNKMPEIFRYSEIFPTKLEGNFEGHIFRVPNNVDHYLTLLYGDYMSPPPVENRKTWHYKEAYLITKV